MLSLILLFVAKGLLERLLLGVVVVVIEVVDEVVAFLFGLFNKRLLDLVPTLTPVVAAPAAVSLCLIVDIFKLSKSFDVVSISFHGYFLHEVQGMTYWPQVAVQRKSE